MISWDVLPDRTVDADIADCSFTKQISEWISSDNHSQIVVWSCLAVHYCGFFPQSCLNILSVHESQYVSVLGSVRICDVSAWKHAFAYRDLITDSFFFVFSRLIVGVGHITHNLVYGRQMDSLHMLSNTTLNNKSALTHEHNYWDTVLHPGIVWLWLFSG